MTKKISELSDAGTLAGTEQVEVNAGGTSKRTTAQDIANLAGLEPLTSLLPLGKVTELLDYWGTAGIYSPTSSPGNSDEGWVSFEVNASTASWVFGYGTTLPVMPSFASGANGADVSIIGDSTTGSVIAHVATDTSRASLTLQAADTQTLAMFDCKDKDGTSFLSVGPALPTADPTIAGRIWNSSGTLKVSAG